MARRRRRGSRKRSGPGRILEGMTILILFLVIFAFGLSIARRVEEGRPGMTNIHLSEAQPTPAEAGAPVFDLARDRVAVLIQNGCGVNGLARTFRDLLHGPQFDVVDYTDADRYDYAETLIQAPEGERVAARSLFLYLQESYQVGRIQLVEDPVSGGDVRIILGADLGEALERLGRLP